MSKVAIAWPCMQSVLQRRFLAMDDGSSPMKGRKNIVPSSRRPRLTTKGCASWLRPNQVNKVKTLSGDGFVRCP
jgi:hypothetical protein